MVGGWVKMLTTMVGRLEKIKKKKHWLKLPLAVSQKTKFEPDYKWFNSSHLEFFFRKYYFGHTTFLRTFQGTSSFFLVFRFSSRKSQSQEKLARKITYFSIRFNSKHLTYFINLNSLDIENNILPKHNKEPFSLYKFSSKHVSVWCQKKNLQWTISWHPRTVFFKHFENKCLYISVYLFKKIFVPKT